ncbi:MAG: ArdC-like ssDNA-binding domain-containing protein [Candidatus Zixiibacteriota bacterium]
MKNNKAKQLIENALTSLTESLEAGQSDELKRYFQTISRFHQYSLRNVMLIALQKPSATHVAGYHTWKKLGRFVRKGETGIVIIAPLVYKKESAEEDDNRSNVTEINGFKGVYVFDISQTDGDDLPEFTSVQGDPSCYQEKLNSFITDNYITLEYSDTLQADGVSTKGKIVIRSGLSPAQDFSVKVHELAHEFLHHTGEKLSKTHRETEAEAVAYVVCQSIGLDTNTAFSDYIQLYKGDKDTLINSIQRIKDVSGRILTGLL